MALPERQTGVFRSYRTLIALGVGVFAVCAFFAAGNSAQAGTRLYLQNASAPYSPASTRGAWDNNWDYVDKKLGANPAGAYGGYSPTETSTTNNYDVLVNRFVSAGLQTATSFTTSDSVNWVLGLLESSTDANNYVHVHMYVTVGDSDTVRGTLLSDSIGATELPTGATGVTEGTKTLSTVSAQAGDRIVLEVGYRAANTSSTSYYTTVYYGGIDTPDLAVGQNWTYVVKNPSYIEFSNIFSTETCSSAASGSWTDGSTWSSPCNVAGGARNANVPTVGSHTLTLNEDRTFTSLTVNGTVRGSGNVRVNGNFTGTGSVNLSGTTTIDGTSSFGGAKEWSFNNLTFGDGTGTSTATANDTPPTVWTEQGSNALPYTTNISGHTVLSYKGKMWFIGGWDQGISDYVRKVYYSTDGITWTQAGTNALPQKLAYHSSVVYKGKMWVIGGNNLSADQRTVYYSEDGATWTQAGTNALPAARKQGAAVVFNGKMWYIGGSNSRDVYSSEDGVTWTTYTNALPTGKSNHVAEVYNGSIYVVGGNYSAKVYSSSNGSTWAEVGTNSFPTTPNGSCMVTYNNKMWVLSGYNNSVYLRTVYYSVNGSTWTQAGTNALPEGQEHSAAVVYKGKMWFLGGDDTVKVWNAGNAINVTGAMTVAANQTLDTSYRTFNVSGSGGVQVAGTMSGTGDVVSGSGVTGSGTVNLTGGTLTQKSGNWYDRFWGYRREVVIDNSKVSGSADLVDFPVLISVTDTNLKSTANNGSVGKSDGTDIFFTLSDGTTKLSHELEKYTASTGELVAWVKVPALSATADTVLFMYYGNAAAPDQQDATGVWDAGYRSVYHLKESANGTSGEYNDSTSRNNDGTGMSGIPGQTTGKIGYGQTFNGSSDYISLAETSGIPVYGTTGYSISFWAKSASGTYGDVYSESSSTDNYPLVLFEGGDTALVASVRADDTTWPLDGVYSYTSAFTSSWKHMVFTDVNGRATLYINGVADGADFNYTYSATTVNVATIGALDRPLYQVERYFYGEIDEFRISTAGSVRSADWIATEFANQDSPGTFLRLGEQSSVPASWYDTAWGFRKKLSVNNGKVSGSSVLADFPVLVSVTDAKLKSTANGGNVGNSDGTDILFTSADGITKLSHELEKYTNTTGELIAWVKVPALSAVNDTTFFMYYGNSGASDQQSMNDVWSNDYIGVWHLKESSAATTMVDSAGNYNGSNSGSTNPASATGAIGSGRIYQGWGDEYTTMGDINEVDGVQHFTLCAWMKRTGNSNLVLLGKESSSPAASVNLQFWNDGNLYAAASYGTEAYITLNDMSWHHVCSIYDGTQTGDSNRLKMVVDGVAQSLSYLDDIPSSTVAASYPFTLGALQLQGTPSWSTGTIDEVQLSSVTRTVDWAITNYANHSDPSTFMVFGTEEAAPKLSSNTSWTFKNLTVGGDQSIGKLSFAGTGSMTVTGNLTVEPGGVLDIGGKTLILSGSGKPLDVRGAISGGSSTVRFTGTSATEIPAGSYYNLEAKPASGSPTYTITSSLVTGWYNSSWPYRKQVMIDYTKVKGGSNLTDFPVLVSVTDSQLKFTGSSGYVGKQDATDMLFTSMNGTTKLAHEIEKYDPATGQLIAWVKVPTVSAVSNTVLYLYYGNSAASDQQDKATLWSDYKGVWHMHDTGAPTTDSTTYANNATQYGNPTLGATGKIGRATQFDGSDDYLQASDSASLNVSGATITMSTWVNFASISKNSFILKKYASLGGYMIGTDTNNKLYGQIYDGNYYSLYTIGVVENTWQYVTVTYNVTGNSMSIYLNGQLDRSQSARNNILSNSGGALQIGYEGWQGDNNQKLTGLLDEMRVTALVRNAGWIATEYENQAYPTQFLSLSGQELNGVAAAGALTIGDGTNAVTLTADANDVPVDVGGTMTVAASAAYTASNSATLTLRGDLTKNGTFTHSNGTVVVRPTASTVTIGGSSDITFYTFTAQQPGKTLQFTNGRNMRFDGTLTMTGAAGNPMWIMSTSASNQWYLYLVGSSPSVTYVNVKDSGCHGSSNSLPSDGNRYDQGNNGNCWGIVRFNGSVTPVEGLSGGGTPLSSGQSSSGTTAADNFERASLGSSWTVIGSGGQIYNSSDYGGSGNNSSSYWSAGTFNSDQFSEMTISSVTGGDYYVKAFVRGGSNGNYYAVYVSPDEWGVGYYVSNAWSSDVFIPGGTRPTAGDAVRLEVIGNSLSVYVNNVLRGTGTHSSLTSGSPGIVADNNTTLIESWRGGSIGTSCEGVCDDFERASLGSNWTVHTGTPYIANSSDFKGSTGGDDGAYWTANTFGNDQFSRAVISGIGSVNYVGVSVRAGNSLTRGYGCQMSSSSAGDFFVLDASNNYYNLGNPGTASVGDTIEIRAIGNAISCLKNDVVVASVTDSRLQTGGAPGIWMYTANHIAALESWSGGNAAQTGGGQSGGGGASP